MKSLQLTNNILYLTHITRQLGIGDWGLGIGPNPQTPTPQSPIPNPQSVFLKLYFNQSMKSNNPSSSDLYDLYKNSDKKLPTGSQTHRSSSTPFVKVKEQDRKSFQIRLNRLEDYKQVFQESSAKKQKNLTSTFFSTKHLFKTGQIKPIQDRKYETLMGRKISAATVLKEVNSHSNPKVKKVTPNAQVYKSTRSCNLTRTVCRNLRLYLQKLNHRRKKSRSFKKVHG